MRTTITKVIKINYIILFFVFIGQISYAQLTDFTLQVSKLDETCPGNGTLSFNIIGQTEGSVVLYSIYLLPDTTTPVTVTFGNSYTGLLSGNYRVIATQSLGDQTNSQQQDIVIENEIIPFEFTLSGENMLCGNDGKIIVTVTQGTGSSYEIISGPVTKPLQESNIFTGLPTGTYLVRAFDNCGQGVVKTYTVTNLNPGLEISVIPIPAAICEEIDLYAVLSPGGSNVIVYPLQVEYTVYPPDLSPPLFFNSTILPPVATLEKYIPLYANQIYYYDLKVTDGCGNVYTVNHIQVNSDIVPKVVGMGGPECEKSVIIQGGTGLQVIAAPAGYQNPLPHTVVLDSGYFTVGGAVAGDYVFAATDICGNIVSLGATVTPQVFMPPSANVLKGCDENSGSVNFQNANGEFVSVKILSAPASFSQALPYDVSFNIYGSKNFSMNSLPPGNYIFHTEGSCGNNFDVPVFIEGAMVSTGDYSVIEGCGTFGLDLHYVVNSPAYNNFWLQKFNPETGQWGYLGDGSPYVEGTAPGFLNSILLTNNAANYNIPVNAIYRILNVGTIYRNGIPGVDPCLKVLDQIEVNGEYEIKNIYSFSCGNNTSDVIVEAVGFGNLIYRITTKNNEPFLVENGNTSIFLGLSQGVYNFQVEDECGNVLNAVYDTSVPAAFEITPPANCNQGNISLSVPSFSFLGYQWWKGEDTANVLSATNSLQFSILEDADAGLYHVRITYTGAGDSCIDFTAGYVITTAAINPVAGEGSNSTYCGSQGQIDLFTLLSGTFNTAGTWQEVTGSGALTGNIWDSSVVTAGAYQFRYKVEGFCEVSNEAIVGITINGIPVLSDVSSDAVICDTKSIQLYASSVPDGAYQWSGPNGFTSAEQNPLLENLSAANNGSYTVKVTANGCESVAASVTIQVNRLPEFIVRDDCIQHIYTLSAMPLNNSFNANDVTYSWSGPENFTSDQSQLTMTSKPKGVYSLTVTTPEGCSAGNSIEVKGIVCEIQKGISPNNDGRNETFDLSGLDVMEIEIFNRYGTVVFGLDNYTDEWHGQDFANHELPDATYFYYIKLGSGEERTGWIYLIR